MAVHTHTNFISNVIGDILHKAYASVAQLPRELLVANEKARTRRVLNRLSNRELEDIGISRADISSEVDKIFKNRS